MSDVRIDNRESANETGHARIRQAALNHLRPSPENDRLYKPVDPSDPEIRALADSILEHGVKEPLVATEDGFLISGHRRYAAACLAGLTHVPCRIEPFRREDDGDRFVVLLREFNRQRVKSLDERLREEIVSIDPEVAYAALEEERRSRAEVDVAALEIRGKTHRAAISPAKQPMLQAVQKIIAKWRKFWPLNDRQIHYGLLNAPPLRHASKPASTYENNRKSYNDLTDLLTRARIAELIPMEAIADETRPVVLWHVYREPGQFIRDQLDRFMTGYWRDLLQSQSNHIEIVAEKNTVAPICRPVCEEYCLPLTSGRGYCSLPPRYQMAERFRQSGKEKFVLLIVSDFDPDGEEIAQSLARSLRDDFAVDAIPSKLR